ncbi:MAG: hypothetical protein IJE10_04905 [Clostridia bacterium]|nr:hypothetical protein [Clostridia bacterium]
MKPNQKSFVTASRLQTEENGIRMERLSRKEAAEFIGCSLSKLYSLEISGKLTGTYYQIGNRKLYIPEKLKKWAENGGEFQRIPDDVEKKEVPYA